MPVSASALSALVSVVVLYATVSSDILVSVKSLVDPRVIVNIEAAGVSTVSVPSVTGAVTRSTVESVTPVTDANNEPSFVKVMVTSSDAASVVPIMATHSPKSMSSPSVVVIALVRTMDALTVTGCANELLVMAKPSDTALANAKSFRVLRLIRFLLIFPRLRYCYSVYEWDKILILSK